MYVLCWASGGFKSECMCQTLHGGHFKYVWFIVSQLSFNSA